MEGSDLFTWSQTSQTSQSARSSKLSLQTHTSHSSGSSVNNLSPHHPIYNEVRLVNPSIKSGDDSSLRKRFEIPMTIVGEGKTVKRKTSMWSLNSLNNKWSSNKEESTTSTTNFKFELVNSGASNNSNFLSNSTSTQYDFNNTNPSKKNERRKTRVASLLKNNLKEGMKFGAKKVSRRVVSGLKTVKKSFCHPEDPNRAKRRRLNEVEKEKEEVMEIKLELLESSSSSFSSISTEPTAPSTPIAPPTVISLRTRSRALRLTAADYLNRSPRSARKIINRGRPINKNSMTNRPLSPRFDIDPERSGENDFRRSPPRTPTNRLRRGTRNPLSPLSLDTLTLSTPNAIQNVTIRRPQFNFFQRAQEDESIPFMGDPSRSETTSIECNLEEGISEFLTELKGDEAVELEKDFEIGDEGEGEGEGEEVDSDVESALICTARTENLSPRSPSFSTIRKISNPSFLVDDAAQIQSLSQNFINPFVFTSPPPSRLIKFDRNLYSTPTPSNRSESGRPLPPLPLSIRKDPSRVFGPSSILD